MKCRRCPAEATCGRTTCDKCSEYMRQQRAASKERRMARLGADVVREEWAAIKRAERERRPFAAAEAQSRYRERHPERERASARRWRERNPGRNAEWSAQNPFLFALYNANRRAGGEIGYEEWLATLERFGYRCAYCLRKTTDIGMDHFRPLSRGGPHELDNIVPACKSCNSRKSDSLIHVWARKLVPCSG